MKHRFVSPQLPFLLTLALAAFIVIELIGYGIATGVASVWVIIVFGGFYLIYLALFRRDALPLIFSLLFFTAYHSLLLHLNRDLPIALLFLIIFFVNSVIMYILLHYATHLKREYHVAYSLISGFLIAQIITLFASTARDWPFRFELASYMPTVFSYIFWRFACFSAEAMLGWRQFVQLAVLIVLLVLAIIIASPNVQV